MKTILLPFNNTQPTVAALDAACLLVGNDGYIEGAFCRQVLPIIAGEGITLPGDYLAEFEEEGRQQAEAARETFRSLLAERSIQEGNITGSGLRAGWTEMVGSGPEGIGEYARLFDLSVISRVVGDPAVDWKTTAEAVLFDSGRPLLIVSNEIPAQVGSRIVVAWNASTETSRTLTAGAALLQTSQEVLVLTVKGATVAGPEGDRLAQHLKTSGINVESRVVERGSRGVGEAILEEAQQFQADLIIKGAYTQSRLRQLIFGGATSDLINQASQPMLMSH
ncbi:MAG TPA: universal stress protein [Arenicellales bacterium]|nr:universal stress protein [Arenicellales bacterium]MDP7220041.1 universal stress protein [Arenicellales bacterium]HJP08898.1 universal stress protein [Arenicellales bacterium]